MLADSSSSHIANQIYVLDKMSFFKRKSQQFFLIFDGDFCCGGHWDAYIEYPQHMFWSRYKKIWDQDFSKVTV